MKRVETTGNNYRFLLRLPEKQALEAILQCYPLVPVNHHRIRREEHTDDSGDDEPQVLLTEAMKEEKRELKSRIDRFLTEEDRFMRVEAGYRLDVSPDDLEWLLRVLNDVRVGSWLALGAPDLEGGARPEVNVETYPHLAAMETAGTFQYLLLQAVSPED